jgi:hypothetical protein
VPVGVPPVQQAQEHPLGLGRRQVLQLPQPMWARHELKCAT